MGMQIHFYLALLITLLDHYYSLPGEMRVIGTSIRIRRSSMGGLEWTQANDPWWNFTHRTEDIYRKMYGDRLIGSLDHA